MRHAPPPLFGEEDRARFCELARQVPDAMGGFGFECRLSAADSRVDFYGSIGPRAGGREALAAFRPPGDQVVAQGWRRLGSFATGWADPTSPLHGGVAMVFLEFDAPFAPLRAPSLFARLALAVGDGVQQWRQAEPLIDDLVRRLLDQTMARTTRDKLHQVFTTLPTGGHVVDVAAMLPRDTTAIRVFASVPRHRLLSYLAQLGWDPARDGAGRDLEIALGVLTEQRSFVSVQLDVSDQLGTRIGLETSGDSDPASPDAWEAVVARAAATGLCSPEKQVALSRWTGKTRESIAASRWPCLLHRLLSHVKLVIEPGLPIEAKAYLWVAPQFSLFG